MQAKAMVPTTTNTPLSATASRLPNQFLHRTASSAGTKPSIFLKPTTTPLPTKPRSTTISAGIHQYFTSPVCPGNTTTTATVTPPGECWSPDSWKSKRASQIPEYPDQSALVSAVKTLESVPQIAFASEARELEEKLAQVALGNAFLLQGGDCGENFKEFNANNAKDTFSVLLEMSIALMFGSMMPVVKVGTMAGLFAKPSSHGDNAFDDKSQIQDPQRTIWAYTQSLITAALLRAFPTGGYAATKRATLWTVLDYINHERQTDRCNELTHWLNEALGFMDVCGALADNRGSKTTTEFWTSHECLHLPYEEALTRKDSTSGLYHNCSAHLLWVGEETRQLDGPHVEFLRGISNPIGIKVDAKMDPDELVKLIGILNPENRLGRITVITQMGADNIKAKLRSLIEAVRKANQIVTWACDPMHGNIIKAPSGHNTISFDSIKAELAAFFEIHHQQGSFPGGVHLEMTGQDVTECLGGSQNITYDDLSGHYKTNSQPRLNASQAIELAIIIAEGIRNRRMKALIFDAFDPYAGLP